MDFDDLDGAEDEALGDDGPVRPLPEWKHIPQPSFDFSEMKERAARSLPGDYLGIEIPSDKDQLLQWGAAWLTRAFQKSGVLPVGNEVEQLVSIKNVTGEVSGGAGLKYIMKLRYREPKPYLQETLFVKLPHPPKGSDRYYVSMMWGHDRPETIFYNWLSGYVPFRVPKLYFADINAASTNFILITETVMFAKKGTTEFGPGDIEPAYDKYCDWELPDGGPRYYAACCRDLGKMAAYHKTGRLHPQVNEMFPMPGEIGAIPQGLPPLDAEARRMNASKADQYIRFLSETAAAAFPKEVTDKAWLETWKGQMMNVLDFEAEIHCFCSGAGTQSPNDYVVLTHNNLQIDNCFFHRDDANELQVGMLDWGALCCGPFIGAIQGGCISGAQAHVYKEHRDSFLRAAIDGYAENGGPRLDLDRLRTMCDLQVALWACNCIKNLTSVLKDTKSAEWAEIKDWMDPKLLKRFYVRAHCSQFKISLQLWQDLGIYNAFRAWTSDQGLPEKKV